jgi:hypothetical protein
LGVSWVSKEDYKNIFLGVFCEKNLKYMWSIQWLSQFKEILGKTLSVWSGTSIRGNIRFYFHCELSNN